LVILNSSTSLYLTFVDNQHHNACFPSVFFFSKGHYFTASLNSLAGLNLGVNLAAILIASPVLGFLPFRAFRLTILKVPKPEMI